MTSSKLADSPLWYRIMVVASLAMFFVNFCYFIAPTTSMMILTKSSITGAQLWTGLTTLVASFAGASFAFLFARHQRKEEKIQSDVAAGNRALFTLTVMYNELRQHQKEIIEPYRNRPDAWLNMHISAPLKEDLSFDTKDLSFLLGTKSSYFSSYS